MVNDHHNEFINVEYQRALYVSNGEIERLGIDSLLD
jgi:hypothetical protein